MLILKILSLFGLLSCSGIYYYPTTFQYHHPEDYQIEYTETQFQSKDGTELHAWHLKSKKPKGLILYFHGNAENLSSHFLSMAWLTQQDYDVLIFDYRGYGRSGGKPQPKGIYQDSLAAMEFAHSINSTNNLIVYGQSLGGNIALRAVQDSSVAIKQLVLDSTFSSYKDLAFDKLLGVLPLIPFSPLAYLLFSDKYASSKVLSKELKAPVLVIHGQKDRVVPYKFGRKIYEQLIATEKVLWSLPEGRHTDVFTKLNMSWRHKFVKFLNSKN